MYETYNYLIKYVKENKDIENLEENYKKILICFSPVIPHISSECLMDLNCTNLEWPVFDKNILVKEKNRFVIQINGKKRALIEAKNDVSEKDLLEILKKDKIVHKYLINKEIKKVIFVKNRLMNILINE